MDAGFIKKCGCCNAPFDAEWKVRDENDNFICPYCGNVNFTKDDRCEEELNKIYYQLDNLQFDTAASNLDELRMKYPKSSKVYFLSVLAENAVCYTEDKGNTGHFIPTLNDLPPRDLMESSFAKKALELAESTTVKDQYLETFNYIETKRKEILEEANKQENHYDIFISTKVTELNDNDREVLDGNGNPKESKDCAFARELYNILREENPKQRIFFSQSYEATTKMTGNKYENVIYAALHSAKILILVGESRKHIASRWVRNEWMRYKRIKDRSDASSKDERHMVLVTHDLVETDLPRELQGYQFIRFTAASGIQILQNYIKNCFKEGRFGEKITARSFDDAGVEAIEVKEIEEMDNSGRKVLVDHVEQVSEDIKDEIECYENQLDPSRKYTREEAFRNLEDLLEREPDAYQARKLLLLKGTNYYHFEDYANDANEVINNPEIANKFFDFAPKEETKRFIVSVIECLTSPNYFFGFNKYEAGLPKNVPIWSEKLCRTLTQLIVPYLDEIEKKSLLRLRRVVNDIIKNKLDFTTPEQTELVNNYLKISQYIDGKDPYKYIDARHAILCSLERCYTNKTDYLVNLQKRLVYDILKTNAAATETIWADYCLRRYGKSFDAQHFIEALEKEEVKGHIVNDKETLDAFDKIFKYTKGDERKMYTLAFLTAIIYDENSYLKEEGQDSLKLSKDVNGDEQLDNEELNGFDLFQKYIGYELPEIVYPSTINEQIDVNSPLLEPNELAYQKKEASTPLDKLFCTFAVRMHKHRIFEPAMTLYNYYLAQQESRKEFHYVLVLYYKEMAAVHIVKADELRRTTRQLQHREMDIYLYQIKKKSDQAPQAEILENHIRNAIEEQQEYSDRYQPIKDILNELPRESTIDKLPTILDIHKQFEEAINSIANDVVRQELEKDFSHEITYFATTLVQLQVADQMLNGLNEQKARSLLWKNTSAADPNARKRIEKNAAYYIELIKKYDEPSSAVEHERLFVAVKNKLLKSLYAPTTTYGTSPTRGNTPRRRSTGGNVFRCMTFFFPLTFHIILFYVMMYKQTYDYYGYGSGNLFNNTGFIIFYAFSLIAVIGMLIYTIARLRRRWDLSSGSAKAHSVISLIVTGAIFIAIIVAACI